MAVKSFRVVSLIKSFLLFFFFALILFLAIFSQPLNFNIGFNFFTFHKDGLNNFLFGFQYDVVSSIFLIIVFFVTTIVLCYSEVYMEHYNNKKFISLLLIFFLSMILLASSRSPLNLLLGWDGLGVSSFCLIIFYPNKTTLFNRVLTMFFNRLGDVVIIFCLGLMILSFEPGLIFLSSNRLLVLACILICSLTKRAQFPLSSWLPAAMSAPTPISAIVHSSTLVTAGIFLVSKLLYVSSGSTVLDMITYISFITFLLGGFIGSLELDFKKIIAFSTISQISIIIFLISIFILVIGLVHMVFHAFFKTLLFCSAGVYFLRHLRNQFSTLMITIGKRYLLVGLVFLRLFRIRGLIFSSSFLTKDLALECLSRAHASFFFLFFLLGRSLTLVYSRKLFFCRLSTPKHSYFFVIKSFFYIFFLSFSAVTAYMGSLMKFYPFFKVGVRIFRLEIYYILLIFLFSLNISLLSNVALRAFSFRVGFMKLFTFRRLQLFFFPKINMEIFLNDTGLVKPYYFLSSLHFVNVFSFYGQFYSFFFLFLIFLFYSVSFFERNIEAVEG